MPPGYRQLLLAFFGHLCHNITDMADTSAYDYLRQSIAGPGALPSRPEPELSDDDEDEYADWTWEDFANLPPRPIPPILTLPPDLDLKDFVNQVEQAYGMNYTQEKYLHDKDDDVDSRIRHAIDLMDEGIVYLSEYNARAASDIFSLCLLLAPNYFYHFCLATARFNIGEYQGALEHLYKTMNLIRVKDPLPEEVAQMADQVPFTDAFYSQFIQCLIFCQKMDEAKKIADFLIEKNVLRVGEAVLEIADTFSLFGERGYAAKITNLVMPAMKEMENKQDQQQILQIIARILTENSSSVATNTSKKTAASTSS